MCFFCREIYGRRTSGVGSDIGKTAQNFRLAERKDHVMHAQDKSSFYFLGANTPSGFFSYYDHLIELKKAHHVYVLKGGPGTGKSSFMKRIGAAMEEDGLAVERIVCSSDPDSLDGLVIPALSVAFVDGTSPHLVDPKFPGAVDSIINLGEYWNAGYLKLNKTAIISLFEDISRQFSKAYRYIASAGALQKDSAAAVADAVLETKLEKFIQRFIRNNLPSATAERGRERRRFLSGITPKGFVFFPETIAAKRGKLFIVEDQPGIGHLFLNRLRDQALGCGLDVFSYYCPMNPAEKLEHLDIPALDMGFITANAYHAFDSGVAKKLNMSRFVDAEKLGAARIRRRFAAKAAKSLLEEAVKSLEAAKALHDTLESPYVSSMDFEAQGGLCEKLIGELRALPR